LLWLLFSSIAWAEPVLIEPESPGVVRVRSTEVPVFMPSCRGVTWERFDEEKVKFVALPAAPCGPLTPPILVGPEGVVATLEGVVLPFIEEGIHVVRAVVVTAQKCKKDKPFPLAACEGLTQVYGPNQVVYPSKE